MSHEPPSRMSRIDLVPALNPKPGLRVVKLNHFSRVCGCARVHPAGGALKLGLVSVTYGLGFSKGLGFRFSGLRV